MPNTNQRINYRNPPRAVFDMRTLEGLTFETVERVIFNMRPIYASWSTDSEIRYSRSNLDSLRMEGETLQQCVCRLASHRIRDYQARRESDLVDAYNNQREQERREAVRLEREREQRRALMGRAKDDTKATVKSRAPGWWAFAEREKALAATETTADATTAQLQAEAYAYAPSQPFEVRLTEMQARMLERYNEQVFPPIVLTEEF